MTAVASQQDTLVSQPSQDVTYVARREDLTLVHTPEYPERDPRSGRQLGITPGVRIQFRAGMLRVPLDGEVATAQGRKFPAGELNEWLQRHPRFGDTWEGFTKVEQVAPPVSDAEMERITGAAVVHNVELLNEILEAERAGWDRAAVTGVVERRLADIVRIQEDIRAQIAAEAQEGQEPAEKQREPHARSKPAKG